MLSHCLTPPLTSPLEGTYSSSGLWTKLTKFFQTQTDLPVTELFLKSKERKGIFTHECWLSCGTRVTEREREGERLLQHLTAVCAGSAQVKSIRITLLHHLAFCPWNCRGWVFASTSCTSESELCVLGGVALLAKKRNPANLICPTPTWNLSVQPFTLNCAICLPGSLLPLALFLIVFFFLFL